jgi:hypothetical protein
MRDKKNEKQNLVSNPEKKHDKIRGWNSWKQGTNEQTTE